MTNSHILVGATTSQAPVVRRISTADIYYALRRGIDDFTAVPSHAVFLCVIYPLLGILLIGVTLGHSLALLPLAFPLLLVCFAYFTRPAKSLPEGFSPSEGPSRMSFKARASSNVTSVITASTTTWPLAPLGIPVPPRL